MAMFDPWTMIVVHTAMMWSFASAFALISAIETGWRFPWQWSMAFFMMPLVMVLGGLAEGHNSDMLRMLSGVVGFIGPAMLIDGGRRFVGLPSWRRAWFAGFTLVVLTSALFTYGIPSLPARLMAFELLTAGVAVVGGQIARRLSRDDHPLSRPVIMIFAGTVVLIKSVHVILLAWGSEVPVFFAQADHGLIVLPATAVAVIAGVGCVVLVAERMAAQIGREARSDVLTGLATRRVFDRAVEHELLMRRRTRRSAAVILFDVDFFKKINDTFGHDIGDRALQIVADCGRAVIRPTDLLARLGGDEFAVLLPETGLADARMVAERLLERLRRTAIPLPQSEVRLSGSFGVAVTEAEEETPATLVKRADLALYEVKRRGRNGVEVGTLALAGAAAG